MSMITEICAEAHAKDLSKVLRKALLTNNHAIIDFCIDNLFPVYQDDCSGAFMDVDPSLTQAYEEIKNGRNTSTGPADDIGTD